MLTELHRAAARHALIPLQNDHEFSHKADVLKRTFPQSVLDAIRAEKKMADQYNKDADEAGGAILTPEAGAYWEDVQLLIKRGKAAQARGDKWTCNGFAPVTYLVMPPWPRRRAG